MSHIRKLGHNFYTVHSGKVGAVVTFGNADASYAPMGGYAAGTRGDFVPWGQKNDQLARMHQLATESPNKWRLIKTRRDFVVGRGVYAHSGQKAGQGSDTAFIPVAFPDFDAWRLRSNWDRLWIRLNMQYAFSGNVFVKLKFDVNGQMVVDSVIDAFKIRPRKVKDGESQVTAFIFNPNMGTKFYKKADDQVLPAFDFANPTAFPVCVLHLMDDLPGQEFFGFAEWWSTEKWTKVANKIPDFHDNGLDNGYNLKYHISIPDDYFENDDLTAEQQEALKVATLQKMSDTLSGVENSEKAFVTFHKVDVNGREVTGVTVKPLDNKMSDNAYTSLFSTANVAQASGHGILPSLAGIDTGGKMGGSGKELEAAANYQQNFLTYVDRFILMTPLRLARAINKWPAEMDFDVRNIQLYNYDVTPTAAGSNPNADKPEEDDAD